MIEELNLFGVYTPAALVWAVLAAVLAYLLRNLMMTSRFAGVLLQPALLELAAFVLFWWGLTAVADAVLPRWIFS
jgi:hypothetical protein